MVAYQTLSKSMKKMKKKMNPDLFLLSHSTVTLSESQDHSNWYVKKYSLVVGIVISRLKKKKV